MLTAEEYARIFNSQMEVVARNRKHDKKLRKRCRSVFASFYFSSSSSTNGFENGESQAAQKYNVLKSPDFPARVTHSLERIQLDGVRQTKLAGDLTIQEQSPLVMARARHTTGNLGQISFAFQPKEELKKGLAHAIDASPKIDVKKTLMD